MITRLVFSWVILGGEECFLISNNLVWLAVLCFACTANSKPSCFQYMVTVDSLRWCLVGEFWVFPQSEGGRKWLEAFLLNRSIASYLDLRGCGLKYLSLLSCLSDAADFWKNPNDTSWEKMIFNWEKLQLLKMCLYCNTDFLFTSETCPPCSNN